MSFVVRRWWPTLALLALGLASVLLLHTSHVRSRLVLQQTIASLDNVSESRRRLLNAYLVHERQAAGDATFAQASALAELRAAEHALLNWEAGRSGIIDFPASAPAADHLTAERRRYDSALRALRDLLSSGRGEAVDLRRGFSAAEQAAASLEAAIRAGVRSSVRAEERAYQLRLGGWGLLLAISVGGATYARRALRSSEGRMAETESRLSRLREAAPVAIAECDGNGRILSVNRMWSGLTGRPDERWIGRPWWEALEKAHRPRARTLWRRDPSRHEATVEARLAAGSTEGESARWVLIHAGRGRNGTADGRRVVTLTDITHQRQVEEQLHHAQRMEAVGRLAGGVAHDFNNLLTSIAGFAALAREELEQAAAVEADLLEIARAADRGRALTRQLLTFSRQERAEPEIVDARQVVRGLERMLGRLVSERVRIESDLGPEAAAILIDPNQLEQVITNLVVNASDAMEGNGRIRIGIRRTRVEEAFEGATTDVQPGEYVLLSVSDTGPGIPPSIKDRVFEPFFTTKERGKGTGLGLSTVWGITRQSGGHIHVYSEIGQGTVFKVYLPVAEGAVVPEKAEGGAQAPALGAPGLALVVEDEEAVRRLTARILELRGWRVLEAASGEEALRRIEEGEPHVDLLITDLMMRGIGGVELVERLRERGIFVPTLFVSGYADSDVDLRDEHFLEKPFTPAALVRSIAAVLEGGASRRA